MASQLGLPLVPDTSYYYPRFYLGLSEGEKRESGEIPSCDMCFDGRYYAVSGFITGAIGAKFPGMNHLVEGVVDTTVSAGERLAYAVFDDSMSWDEKWAYAFDPGQMVADFVTGVVIGEILDGIMAAIQNRLRSIFANYDAAMREAFESGRETVKIDEFFIDDWTGYPDVPKPDGPFRILEGTEYTDARNLANKTNANIHRNRPDLKGTLTVWKPPIPMTGTEMSAHWKPRREKMSCSPLHTGMTATVTAQRRQV